MHLTPEVKKYFDTQAAKRALWRRKNSYYYDSLEAFVAFLVPQNSRVLHIGADSSALLNRLIPSQGVGIHSSERVIEEVRKQTVLPHITFEQKDVANVQGEFDYAILSDMLGYVDDIQAVLEEAAGRISWNGRIVVTQYSALWEPVLKLGSALGLRMPSRLQNWISRADLENFAHLAGLETVRSGTRMLFPKYIPLLRKSLAQVPK